MFITHNSFWNRELKPAKLYTSKKKKQKVNQAIFITLISEERRRDIYKRQGLQSGSMQGRSKGQ